MKVEHSLIWQHAQDLQITKYQLNCNCLIRKFNTWEKYQQLYMPASVSMRSSDQHDAMSKKSDEVYNIPLWLPSQVVRLQPGTQLIDHCLLDLEWKLCLAQAYKSLDQIWHHLLILLQTVRTPTLCIPDTLDRPGYFLFNLLNLATPLLSHAVRLVLLCFVLLSSLPCSIYDAVLILTLGYRLFTNTYVS